MQAAGGTRAIYQMPMFAWPPSFGPRPHTLPQPGQVNVHIHVHVAGTISQVVPARAGHVKGPVGCAKLAALENSSGQPRKSLTQLAKETGRRLYIRSLPIVSHGVASAGAEVFVILSKFASEPCGWRDTWAQLRGGRGGHRLFADEEWAALQYRLVVWKLTCQERCFPLECCQLLTAGPGASSFIAEAAFRQLRARYEREFGDGSRPALRLLAEGDCSASAHMLLCIASIDLACGALELTDGWYIAWAACDSPLRAQLHAGRLAVGSKLRVCGATEPKAVVDSRHDEERLPWMLSGKPTEPRLELHANGTRRAAWDAQLGLHSTPAFRVGLGSLQEGGGAVPLVHVLVARAHGPLVFERRDGGCSRWLTLAQASRVAECEHLGTWQKARDVAIDATSCDIDSDLRRSLCTRLTLVDAASPATDSGRLNCIAFSTTPTPPYSSGADRKAYVSIWGNFNDGPSDGLVECGAGYIVRTSPSVGVAPPFVLGLEVPRGGWMLHSRSASSSRGASSFDVLTRRGLARVPARLYSLPSLRSGALFDFVGHTVLLGSATPTEAGWGGAPMQARMLFLANNSLDLLCVRWLHPPEETIPKLRIGILLTALDLRCVWPSTGDCDTHVLSIVALCVDSWTSVPGTSFQV